MSDSGPPPGGGEGLSVSQDGDIENETQGRHSVTGVQTSDSIANSASATTGAWASGGMQKCRMQRTELCRYFE